MFFCPLLALSGQSASLPRCPLMTTKRTLFPRSIREAITKHRQATLRLRASRLVLQDIPVFGQDIVGTAHNVCGNPAPRAPISRGPSMDDDEVPLRHDDAGLVFERRRCAFDQIEEAFAARLDVRTVLDVAGRPKAFSRHIV